VLVNRLYLTNRELGPWLFYTEPLLDECSIFYTKPWYHKSYICFSKKQSFVWFRKPIDLKKSLYWHFNYGVTGKNLKKWQLSSLIFAFYNNELMRIIRTRIQTQLTQIAKVDFFRYFTYWLRFKKKKDVYIKFNIMFFNWRILIQNYFQRYYQDYSKKTSEFALLKYRKWVAGFWSTIHDWRAKKERKKRKTYFFYNIFKTLFRLNERRHSWNLEKRFKKRKLNKKAGIKNKYMKKKNKAATEV